MSLIYKDYGAGGAGIGPISGISAVAPSKRHAPLAKVLRDIADDLSAMKGEEAMSRGNALVVDIADLRTKFIAALGALDGDASVTDTNYAATQSPAALTAAAIVSSSSLVAQLNALVVDYAAIRAKIVTALAKLDADGGVSDTNYAALWTPAAMTGVAITDVVNAVTLINALVVDRAALRTALAGAYAKLDADAGVALTTYAATYTPVAATAGAMTALLTLKG